jgi:hypothetical protein
VIALIVVPGEIVDPGVEAPYEPSGELTDKRATTKNTKSHERERRDGGITVTLDPPVFSA